MVNLYCHSCLRWSTVTDCDQPKCSYFFCGKILAYKSTCKKCNKIFWSRYPVTNCYSCIKSKCDEPKYYNSTCQKCNKKFLSRFPATKCYNCSKLIKCLYCDNDTLDTKCNNCINKKILCRCCHKKINTTNNRLVYFLDKPYHEKCYDHIKEYGDEFYNDIEIKIIYQKDYVEHDGYCSDPGEEQPMTVNTTKYYPLLKVFPYHLNHGKFKLYRKNKKGCHYGSGYCGNDVTYTIIDSKIILTNHCYFDIYLKSKLLIHQLSKDVQHHLTLLLINLFICNN